MEQGKAACVGLYRDRLRRSLVHSLADSRMLLLAGLHVLLILLCYGPTDNWRWDPSFYYAQLRAPVIDRQLDFRPETLPHNGIASATETGLQPSPWPLGPALLWTPFLLAAHLYMAVAHGTAGATGFEPLYVASVSAGSALYGLLGVLLVYRICRFVAGQTLAGLSTGLIVLGTPLFYYIYRQPIMAHSTSFLASASLLLVCLLAYHRRLDPRVTGLALGVCIGLNILMRWTSVLLALVPLSLWVGFVIDARRRADRAALRYALVQLPIAGAAVGVTVLPQLALWYRLHGRWLVFPSQGFSATNFATNIVNVFFSTNRGLLFWSPVLLLGMLGLVMIRPRALCIGALIYLGAHLGILGLWHDWFGGGGFGPRYFIETLPVVALGLAALLNRLKSQPAVWLAGGLGIALTFHQFVLMAMVEHGWVPMHDYYKGLPLGLRVQLDGLARALGQPGLLFAARPEVGPQREALIVSVLSGQSDLSFYLMPLVGLVVITLGLAAALLARTRRVGLGAALLARTRRVGLGAALLVCYMVGWFCFLLAI